MIPGNVPESDKYSQGIECNKDAGVFCFLCVFIVSWVDDESAASRDGFLPCRNARFAALGGMS